MGLKVSRILHAGYVFEHAGTSIAFDPIFENPFSRNCHAFPEVRFEEEMIRQLKFDAVFISHHHDDHCSFESLALLDRGTPIHLFCAHAMMFEWLRKMGFREVHPLVIDAPVRVGGMTVTPRRALDADVDSILQIEAEGRNVLNLVDSWIDDETLDSLAATKWDLILWPFQTMRESEVLTPGVPCAPSEIPSEWLEQLRRLRPECLVPSSCQFRFEDWSWLNRAFFPISYARFAAEVTRAIPATKIARLNPGRALELGKTGIVDAEPLPWLTPVGEQNVDYEFDLSRPAQSTAEIARCFPALEVAEQKVVDRFLEELLASRLAALGPSSEPFFQKRRRWRLSVFGCEGIATHHDFMLDEENLVRSEMEAAPEWTTEIIARKLYGALHEGESLTSMYVRINPGAEDADVLEDPLLRALFNGRFGAYQLAQLEKLLGAQV